MLAVVRVADVRVADVRVAVGGLHAVTLMLGKKYINVKPKS